MKNMGYANAVDALSENNWLPSEINLIVDANRRTVALNALQASTLIGDVRTVFDLGFHSRRNARAAFCGKNALFFTAAFALGMKARGNTTGQVFAIPTEGDDDSVFCSFLDLAESSSIQGLITPYRMGHERARGLIPNGSLDTIMVNECDASLSIDQLSTWDTKRAPRGVILGTGAGDISQGVVRQYGERVNASVSIRKSHHDNFWEIDRINGAIASVLLPTLGRSDLCIRSIESCLTHAEDPSAVEILCYFDEGDESIHAVRSRYHDNPNIRFFVFPPVGYRYLYVFLNEMCRSARGRWLLLWNDDAEIITKDWDSVLQGYGDRMCLCSPIIDNYRDYQGTIFPFIPRKWFEITGCFSNQTHIDTWVEKIANQTGTFVREPRIVNFHDRFSETGKNDDQTYRSRQYASEEFFSPPFENQRKYQAHQIMHYLQSLGEWPPW